MYRFALIPLFALACAQQPTVPVTEPASSVQPAVAQQVAPAVAPAAAGPCQPVALAEGATGTYEASDGDDHRKHHFLMPEGVSEVRVKATWPDAAWQLRVDLGEGGCPHSGTTHHSADGAGEVAFTYAATAMDQAPATFPAGGQWFVHLAINNPQAAGNKVDYALDVQTCTAVPAEG